MHTKRIGPVVLAVCFIASCFFSLSAQTSPVEFLGHRVGEDGKLADYNQVLRYFQLLDRESPGLQLLEIGRSVQGRPIVMAVISSPANLENAEGYRNISRRLRDERELTEADARELASAGRSILLISCSLHATEIGASQMSMELAWQLTAGKTPFTTRDVLDNVIVLLVPTTNPDGVQMVVDWYEKYRGTRYEGGRMPWLYHHYAGHDNNRDWFMGNLPETRALTKVLYHDWIPQIHIDEHQMGSSGARLFIPPFNDPPTGPVHPLVWRGIALCGSHMAYRLEEEKKRGVVHGRSFTGWWIGACDDTSWLHNAVGILSEMASVRIASPVFIESGEIHDEFMEKSMQYPHPWPGGWWRLRDIVEYELTLSMALIEAAALYRESFLLNFYRMCRDAAENRREGQPTAFLIPHVQHDAPTARRMLRILQFGGVNVHRTTAEARAGQRMIPAGTWVVRMDQPYQPYAQALLERQRYPDMRLYPGGPPIPPYDNAGWTLPLQMGVECIPLEESLDAKMERVIQVEDPRIVMGKDQKWAVLRGGENSAHQAVFALLDAGVSVMRAITGSEPGDDADVNGGDFLVPLNPASRPQVEKLQHKFGFSCCFMDQPPSGKIMRLRYPRIGIYQSWNASMDEGWTRYMLDDAGIRFQTLHNQDISRHAGKKGLSGAFDVIVLPSEDRHLIVDGEPAPDSPWKRYYSPLPPEYQGGIGKKGVNALKEFVRNGGHLVCLNRASDLVLEEFQPPVTDLLKGVKRDKFFCPMSILGVEVDTEHPLGLGLEKKTAVVFSQSPAFSTWVPQKPWQRRVVARYPERGILESGWLLGESLLSRRAAMVDLEFEKGHIVLFGFRPQSRAQSHGAYKFLFNAFLRSAWTAGQPGGA
ncbi:MAG: M14 family metallopeptidase [Acidobacteriota bacterium]|jgi:hypothetical protein|nr:M14 family metallopeptidase [Acidobacteriota bacterium]